MAASTPVFGMRTRSRARAQLYSNVAPPGETTPMPRPVRQQPASKRQAARNPPLSRSALSDVTNDTPTKLPPPANKLVASPANASAIPPSPASKPTDSGLEAVDPCTPLLVASKGVYGDHGERHGDDGDNGDDGAEALRSVVSRLLLSSPCQEDTPEIVTKSKSKLVAVGTSQIQATATTVGKQGAVVARCFSVNDPDSAIYNDGLRYDGDDDEGAIREDFAHQGLCDVRDDLYRGDLCEMKSQQEHVTPLRRRRRAAMAPSPSHAPRSAVKTPATRATLTTFATLPTMTPPSLLGAPTPQNTPEGVLSAAEGLSAPPLTLCASSPVPRAFSLAEGHGGPLADGRGMAARRIPRCTASVDGGGGISFAEGGAAGGTGDGAEGGAGSRSRAKSQVGGKIGGLLARQQSAGGKDPAGLLTAIAALRERRASQQRQSKAGANSTSSSSSGPSPAVPATATAIATERKLSFGSPQALPALARTITIHFPSPAPAPASRRVEISASAGAPQALRTSLVLRAPRSPSPMRRARIPRTLSSPAPDHSLAPSLYQDAIPAVDLGAPWYPTDGTAPGVSSVGGAGAGAGAIAARTPVRTPASQRGSTQPRAGSPPWSTQVNVGTPGSSRRGGWAERMARGEEEEAGEAEGEEGEKEGGIAGRVRGGLQRREWVSKGLLDALERMGVEEEEEQGGEGR